VRDYRLLNKARREPAQTKRSNKLINIDIQFQTG
jgi:hypothetical protein